MQDDPTHLRSQAKKCRWIAAQQTDPATATSLRMIADEYETRASIVEELQARGATGGSTAPKIPATPPRPTER